MIPLYCNSIVCIVIYPNPPPSVHWIPHVSIIGPLESLVMHSSVSNFSHAAIFFAVRHMSFAGARKIWEIGDVFGDVHDP